MYVCGSTALRSDRLFLRLENGKFVRKEAESYEYVWLWYIYSYTSFTSFYAIVGSLSSMAQP